MIIACLSLDKSKPLNRYHHILEHLDYKGGCGLFYHMDTSFYLSEDTLHILLHDKPPDSDDGRSQIVSHKPLEICTPVTIVCTKEFGMSLLVDTL